MKKLPYLLCTVILLIVSGNIYGQEVTLKEAVAMALERNNLIKASKFDVASKEAVVSVARSSLLPKLYVDESFIRTDNPAQVFTWKLNQRRFSTSDFAVPTLNNPPPINNFQTFISLEHPIFDWKTWFGLGIAKKDLQASQHDLEQHKQDVAFKVFNAYLNIQTAQTYLETAEASVAEAQEHLRAARARVEAEVGLKSDELRAMVFLSEAEEKKIKAANDVDVAKHALALAMGGEADSFFGAKEKLTERPIESDISALIKDALRVRSDLKGMDSRVQNASNAVKMARADYLPTASFSGTYELDDHNAPFRSEGNSWFMMVQLRWEIFDGLRRSAEVVEAQRVRRRSQEILEGMRKEVAFRVREGYLRVQEAKKRLEIAEKALADAEEGVRLIRARYENALSTMVELLDVQTALNTARSNVIKAHNDYLLSQAKVRHEAGIFLQSVMEDNWTNGI